MTFSDTVAQRRDQQEKNLKRFVAYSLAGSFLLHSGFLLLRVHDVWQSDVSEPEEIAIVVTEPSENEPAEAIPPEKHNSEPGELGFAGGDGSGDASAATVIEAPAAPQSSTPETPAAEEPMTEEEPESRSVPVTEEIEPSTTKDLTEAPANPLAGAEDVRESEDVSETAPQPRNLNRLLEDLRRAREQPRGNSSLTEGDRPSTAAVGTGTGTGLGQSGGTGSGRGNGTGSGRGIGAGSADQGNPAGTGSGANRGSSSREVSCRGCDFDYPEEADGVEGTAQVIVETDGQGRVVSVMLSRSSGNAALDQAALEQARQRVRLNNARAGESYPIDIDFVQTGSEAAQQARERGDRRSITISDPEPETTSASESSPESVSAPETPVTTSSPSPASELASPATKEPSTNSEPESSVSPAPVQEPSITPEAEPDANPSAAEPDVAPEPPPVPPSLPEQITPEPAPALDLAPEPDPEPALEPAPDSAPAPDPVPASAPDSSEP